MRKILFAVCLSFIFRLLSAQEGSPLLTHFRQDRDIENQNWAICQDTDRIMLFANRKGILAFDGEEWISVRLPLTPLVIKMNPYDKKIYVGGENSFGCLEKDRMGVYRYMQLSDSASPGIISQIIFIDSTACFFGYNSFCCFDIPGKNLRLHLQPKPGLSFTGALINRKNIFVNVAGKGLHRIDSDTLFPVVSGYITEQREILFSLPYNDEKTLIGTGDGKLLLFDGIRFSDYSIDDDGYLKENIVSEGIMIGDSLFAFSTLGGGALVAEKLTGKVLYIINNMKGLPDDEIFAIGKDASGGLWLSHPFGLTRADLNLPAGNFSIYPGLAGNLSTAVKYSNELYVATSEGVFYLANEKRYTEVEVVKRNEIQPAEQSAPLTRDNDPVGLIAPSGQRNQRRGLFSRIFGKKEDAAKESPSTLKAQDLITVKEVPLMTYTTQKVRKLKSIDYVYKKVGGLNEKCRQLVPTKNGILAATNRGLYVIRDHKALPVVPERYINFVSWNQEYGFYSVAASDGYFFVEYRNGKWLSHVTDINFRYPVYSILRQADSIVWLGSNNTAYRVVIDRSTGETGYESFSIDNPFTQRYLLRVVNDTLYLFTETGISRYIDKSSGFASVHANESEVYRYPLSNIPLIMTGNDLIYYEQEKKIRERDLCLLRLFDDIVSVYSDEGHIWVVEGENRLFGIDTGKVSRTIRETDLIVKNVRNEKGTSFDLSDIVFERGDNVINFDIVVPAYLNRDLTEYQYYIEGVMTGWSPWSSKTSYSRGIPKPGSYMLKIRAKDLWGQVGEPVSVNFTIKAPFTQTTLFYIISIIIALFFIFLLIRFRERQLHEKNRILEQKVRERTAEIEAQKEEITSSIEYASRIQYAMLPFPGSFNEYFSDYFIIFKPRDIVSGDFYWIGGDDKNLYITVADCTGHGVPGAFMSTLGISVLNEIVTHNKDVPANVFLNILRERIKILLHQTGKEGEAADGMDISLCVLNKSRNRLQFSGAYNPLYIHSDGELREFKADRMPIGIHYGEEASFTNNEITVRKGDVLYMISDGLTDQFGGPEGSKFKKAQLKRILSEIYMRPMSEQKKLIELEFLRWKGYNDQIDDVTVLGVRI